MNMNSVDSMYGISDRDEIPLVLIPQMLIVIDGQNDGAEVMVGTDPLDASSNFIDTTTTD